jgi:hypothetical protein
MVGSGSFSYCMCLLSQVDRFDLSIKMGEPCVILVQWGRDVIRYR